MGAEIYLDISRLLRAGFKTTPSGIERVEISYVKEFCRTGKIHFVAALFGQLNCLPNRFTLAYINALGNLWKVTGRANNIKAGTCLVFMYFILLAVFAFGIFRRRKHASGERSVYLNLSHENLVARAGILGLKSRTGAKLLFFVHDLIPITHPEYARRGEARRHRRRIDTVGDLADAVLVNSVATKNELFFYFKNKASLPAVHVVHLGVTNGAMLPACGYFDTSDTVPYFICLATIEPRKNHLLLLNLWRSLAADTPLMPRLIIVGRRGWENEMVLDMLERCPSLGGIVEERRGVSDDELNILMKGARALLLPSFAEGYGLPVPEALCAGTPVICSDLPALREVGGDVPEYIDPLDGAGWRRAILDYTEASSQRRAAQCERLLSWSVPRWDTHFNQVYEIIKVLTNSDHWVA